jgi:hypothetical protein
MTIATVQPEFGDVMLVTEWNRLLHRLAQPRLRGEAGMPGYQGRNAREQTATYGES